MKRRFQAVKGTRDILPPASALWNQVEQTARRVFAAYNFQEIRLPLFEETELFARSVGADTDIIAKETYSFLDPLDPDELQKKAERVRDILVKRKPELGGFRGIGLLQELKELLPKSDLVTLRPEATASVVRAYIEHGMHTQPGLTKLYYIGPMFRRERPQKGRFRQFYQIGIEALGPSDSPALDAEIIEVAMVFIEQCGLKGCALYVNSIGCPAPAPSGAEGCRPKYIELLRRELKKVQDRLGPDSQRRIETNPLRVFDSKVEGEQPVIASLPSILDHLCPDCRAHFDALQQELRARGFAFEINYRLVRGLDYYTRTTFEITAPGLGAQNAVCGGGRYDGLSELLGGPPTKGIGWALGTDRLILTLEQAGSGKAAERLDVFIIWLGAAAYARARELARRLRQAGVRTELAYEEMKLKKALSWADRAGARAALILGEDELAQNKFTLRDMRTGDQRSLSESELLLVLSEAKGDN